MPFSLRMKKRNGRSMVNAPWGFFNLVVGYLLVCRVGSFALRNTTLAVVPGVGMLRMSVMPARAFGRFHGGI